jgi:hypothetical protein
VSVSRLDLSLGLMVDFIADEMGMGDLGVVVVELDRFTVDLQVQRLGVNWRDWLRLRHLDYMMNFRLMMLKLMVIEG